MTVLLLLGPFHTSVRLPSNTKNMTKRFKRISPQCDDDLNVFKINVDVSPLLDSMSLLGFLLLKVLRFDPVECPGFTLYSFILS